MAQRPAVADDGDARWTFEPQQLSGHVRHALTELALRFAVRWRFIPRIGAPHVALAARDLVPAESFPCPEIELAQLIAHAHLAGISSGDRQRE